MSALAAPVVFKLTPELAGIPLSPKNSMSSKTVMS
jgi:hypothetical protein